MAVKTKMLTVAVQAELADKLDALIKESKLYSSRSEFLKDAIRKTYRELLEHDPELKKIHAMGQELAAIARSRGFNGKLPSKAERNRRALEYMKENGWTY